MPAASLAGMSASRFSSDVYARRLAAAAAAAADAGLAGLVITPGYDLRYLVGSAAQTFERLTALVVPAAGAPIVVVPRLELASLKESAVVDLGLLVQDWVDGENPYDMVAVALGGHARVAVTDSMPALHLLPLAATARRGAGAGHRRAALAADGQGSGRDRRAAQGRRRDRPGARPGARVPRARPHRSRRRRRYRQSHCGRRSFSGGVHHRRLRSARRRPAPRMLRAGAAGR